MKETIFNFIADLEQDIARFYEKQGLLSRFPRSAELFRYMSEQSIVHSYTVQKFSEKYTRPQLDNDLVQRVHMQIKQSLEEEIHKSENTREAMTKIARAEELVGKMYQMMAKRYRDLGEYYTRVAADIDTIAEEEFVHRDMVISESGKYK